MWAWLAGRRLAVDGGVVNITAAAWTAGFHWWRFGNITRTQNVSEYMLVLALCLIVAALLAAQEARERAYTQLRTFLYIKSPEFFLNFDGLMALLLSQH